MLLLIAGDSGLARSTAPFLLLLLLLRMPVTLRSTDSKTVAPAAPWAKGVVAEIRGEAVAAGPLGMRLQATVASGTKVVVVSRRVNPSRQRLVQAVGQAH